MLALGPDRGRKRRAWWCRLVWISWRVGKEVGVGINAAGRIMPQFRSAGFVRARFDMQLGVRRLLWRYLFRIDLFGARMRCIVDLRQALEVERGVHLGCADRSVAQHLLHCA